jgi:tRNA A-37 threonylcarbamoyl transferase component Bud32/tetratricopeptide (TPR) repeat protein
LKTIVGDSYRIEKELGGGGMSRVFLAEEVELARRVVIKVLPPEMAAEVNKERFHREIQLAAKLQHPHVVSLLTAGAEGDLLYYVMPYIEGESLRAKLSREGELPVGEAVRLLEEVVDALAYAHSEGVVHRDIKPDNVLLSRDHAVVTDFGVSKAVSASSGASSLTSLGVALGTPAYMAPEQAAADPHTDYRADIYAAGAMAYEMLTGRPPFTAPTPQAVMAAHVSEVPEPVTRHRSAVSEALNALVMRCLEKKAADRWQSAAELVPLLKAMATPSGGMTPTGTQPVTAVSGETAARHAHPVRVAALFGLTSVGALAIVYFLMQFLGLPNWVLAGAIVLLAIGFPIMILTGHHERRRGIARTTGVMTATPAGGVQRHLTWPKALLGGAAAFAGLGTITAVFMGMRTLGIGPVGTLVAAGVIEERAPIILADFVDRTGDSTLASALTEAFRVDLAQSEIVTLMPVRELREALGRMRRDPAGSLDAATAQELAVREGVGAVVAGEINAAGSGFVLSAQLLTPESGEVLAAFRETAADESEVIPAIDRLSRSLRERIGESYTTMRGQERLHGVTTGSLEALRRYSAGTRAEFVGDNEQALSHYEAAVRLDTTFAMAFRKLSVVLANSGTARWRVVEAGRKAFEYRDRLPELERYQTTLYYYANVEIDRQRAVSEGRAALERYPDDPTLLTTLSQVLNVLGRHDEVEVLAHRGRPYGLAAWSHEMDARLALGKLAAAESTAADFEAANPGHWWSRRARSAIAVARGDFATARRETQFVLDSARAGVGSRAFWSASLAALAMTQGHLAAAQRLLRESVRLSEQQGAADNAIRSAIWQGWIDLTYRDDNANGLLAVEEVLERHPLGELHPMDRPYAELAEFYAAAGNVERARDLLAEYEAEVDEVERRGNFYRHVAAGVLAVAEDRYEDAIAAFGKLREEGFIYSRPATTYYLANTFDIAGQTDSALAGWESAVMQNALFVEFPSALRLAHAYRRMGEIYEERGEPEKAVQYYNEFVELWNDADDELQPQVTDVRGRIARLISET